MSAKLKRRMYWLGFEGSCPWMWLFAEQTMLKQLSGKGRSLVDMGFIKLHIE